MNDTISKYYTITNISHNGHYHMKARPSPHEFKPKLQTERNKDMQVSTNSNKSGIANRKDDNVNVCMYSSNRADRHKENVNVV